MPPLMCDVSKNNEVSQMRSAISIRQNQPTYANTADGANCVLFVDEVKTIFSAVKHLSATSPVKKAKRKCHKLKM